MDGDYLMSVVLYSTHCPRCNVLEKKLKSKNIGYTEINDVEVMQQKGFKEVPMLEVDGNIMNFKNAINWMEAY